MSNFLKIKKNINSVVKYEAGISKLADRKKIIKLSLSLKRGIPKRLVFVLYKYFLDS